MAQSSFVVPEADFILQGSIEQALRTFSNYALQSLSVVSYLGPCANGLPSSLHAQAIGPLISKAARRFTSGFERSHDTAVRLEKGMSF